MSIENNFETKNLKVAWATIQASGLRAWLNLLTKGKTTSINELAEHLNEDRNEISRFLPLAFLAPDITEKILAGKQPIDLTYERLRRMPPLSCSWKEQREHLGFAR